MQPAADRQLLRQHRRLPRHVPVCELRWVVTYQEQLQQQHQQKQQALEPRGLTWPGWPCWAGAVPPAADSCCADICLFRISIRSDPMGCRHSRVIEFSLRCYEKERRRLLLFVCAAQKSFELHILDWVTAVWNYSTDRELDPFWPI